MAVVFPPGFSTLGFAQTRSGDGPIGQALLVGLLPALRLIPLTFGGPRLDEAVQAPV
jgi:hypothetical protein